MHEPPPKKARSTTPKATAVVPAPRASTPVHPPATAATTVHCSGTSSQQASQGPPKKRHTLLPVLQAAAAATQQAPAPPPTTGIQHAVQQPRRSLVQPHSQEMQLHSPVLPATETQSSASGGEADFCVTPPPPITPPPQDKGPVTTEEGFTLTMYDVDETFQSDHASDSLADTEGADDAVSDFINSIPDDLLGVDDLVTAHAANVELDNANVEQDNAGGTGAQAAAEISAVVERLNSLEGTVRATAQDVQTHRQLKTELMQHQNILLDKQNTELGFIKDYMVQAERQRREDHLKLARRQRVGRKRHNEEMALMRETLLGLAKQVEVTGDKIANTIAQHTTVVRLAQAAPKLDTIQESTSDTSSQQTSPATSPPPPQTVRRGLRLQRGGKKCSD